MKSHLLTLTMVCFSSIAMAQSGSWYAGGVVGFGSTNTTPAGGTKQVSSSWAFAPEVGTFLKDDIQLGLALGITGTADKDDGTKDASFVSISPTVYSRKFFKITDSFSAFAGLYLNYTTATDKDFTVTPTDELKYSGIGLRLGIGVAYALSPRFAVVGQYGLMGFQSLNFKNNGNDQGSISAFDLGVNTVGSNTLSQGNGSGSVFNIGIYYTIMP
jgi:outer membrane protein W